MTDEINKIVTALKDRIGTNEIDGSIKFAIEEVGTVVIIEGEVKESDEDTDCTLSGTLETFMDIFNGETSSTAAFMSGTLKIDGSMGTAMKYNSILS